MIKKKKIAFEGVERKFPGKLKEISLNFKVYVKGAVSKDLIQVVGHL